ncbi:MAG: transposase [Deltaproteobacteria bacterium]|nr:transposase [Deltaproteobacteria bacterium]
MCQLAMVTCTAHGEPEIVNTDQGSQFTSPIFTKLFDEIKTQLSMDGKGRWIDNVFIERFWRNIKYEKIYLEPSEDGIELYGKIKWYMEFYNTRRPQVRKDLSGTIGRWNRAIWEN